MSTIKTDTITALSTNGDLSLDGAGTGGVSIASTLKMAKGGDISSASPLVIDTDGNYFDVTGTTNFSAMTVESGNFFMLQFDGALTITHGSGIELPGAANLTTAAGDRLICYATAANTVEVMSVATEAAADSSIGLQTIWVPAAAMRPTSSNGSSAITDVETTSGRPDLQVLDFDDAADEHAQFQVGFPKSWNEGTITFRAFWTSTATDTDGVAWGLQGVSVANDGTIDVAYGTAVVVTDDNISAAEDCLVTATSGSVTIASAAADTMTFFRIFRDISDGNDDMAEDARLIGVQMFYTIDALTDAQRKIINDGHFYESIIY